MDDVGAWLVPPVDDPLALHQHRRFLEHMAALQHRFLGFTDTIGLAPLSHRYLVLSPDVIAPELARPDTHR